MTVQVLKACHKQFFVTALSRRFAFCNLVSRVLPLVTPTIYRSWYQINETMQYEANGLSCFQILNREGELGGASPNRA